MLLKHRASHRTRRNQHGIALPAVAIFLLVLAGFTAVGIDIARLAHTATEVQTVADLAARAGAKALQDNGGAANTGITRAHQLSEMNAMNGALTIDADVKVDEGFFNSATQQFECCTTNSPCCANDLSMTDWSCVAGTARCATARKAALAMPSTSVNNLLAGVIGAATTTVEKVAVAALKGPGSGCAPPPGCSAGDFGCFCDHGAAPCLPITAPSCEFDLQGSLPNLQVSANGSDTAGWWTPGSTSTSSNTVRDAMDQDNSGPCNAPSQGNLIGGSSSGSSVSLNNGINSSANRGAFGLVRCLAAVSGDSNTLPQGCALDGNGNIIPGQRGRVFTIPIFDSGSSSCTGNFNQNHPIVGYATIEIISVDGAVGGNNPTASPLITIVTRKTVTTSPVTPTGDCFSFDCSIALAR